jgi:hypothetical protein
VISGKILTAEFPERGIEVTNVDDIAGGIVDFDTVTDAKWLTNENTDLGDKTFHRGLHGQTNNDRADAERGEGGVPIHENHGHGDDGD